MTELFEADQAAKLEEKPTEVVSPETDILKSITSTTGEQKYQTTTDALYALKHSQEHIAKIEAENTELRGSAELGDRMDKLFTKLEQEPKKSETPAAVGSIGIEDIKEVTAKVYKDLKAEDVVTGNLNKVDRVMGERYGDKAKELVAQKANDLGVGIDFLMDMAARSPDGFVSLFPAPEKSVGTSELTGSVNADALKPNESDQDLTPKTDLLYGAPTSEVLAHWNKVGDSVKAELNS